MKIRFIELKYQWQMERNLQQCPNCSRVLNMGYFQTHFEECVGEACVSESFHCDKCNKDHLGKRYLKHINSNN